MGQYSYYLGEPENREECWNACMREAMETRMSTIRETVRTNYQEKKDEIQESFYCCVAEAMEQMAVFLGTGRKGLIRYLHFSYLLSGALSGEMLLKMDGYDEHYFSDIRDLDCFWDYSCLYPEYSGLLTKLKETLYEQVPRLTQVQWQRAGLYYQVCNVMALEEMIQELVKTDRFASCIQAYAQPEVAVLYGAYLDQAELIHKLGGD